MIDSIHIKPKQRSIILEMIEMIEIASEDAHINISALRMETSVRSFSSIIVDPFTNGKHGSYNFNFIHNY